MNYESIIDLFLETDAGQWQRVSGNHEYAFCKADVNLRIVSTLAGPDIQQDDFRADWANRFPESRARGYYYNLYYGATLVHRFILVAVDGACALLPVPKIGTDEVTLAQWKAAEIFDISDTLNDYLSRAGLTLGTDSGL